MLSMKTTPLTEVRQPLPGEQTFDRNYYILSIGSEYTQKCFGRGRQILVEQFRAVLIEHTDVHRFRMEIDATILCMLLRVEVHPGFLLGDRLLGYSHPTAATRSKGGLDEYQSRARDRRPLAV